MDYVTRQFINLSKKLRKDLRILITNLTSALEKQTEAIRKASRASEQQQTPPPPATVIHLPERIEVHQNADEARKEDNYRRATFFISSLTLAAIVAYAILVNWQYQQMIVANVVAIAGAKAAKQSADIAKEALYSVQRAFVITKPEPDVILNVDPRTRVVQNWAISIPIENAGATPTRSLHDQINWVFTVDQLPKNYRFLDRKPPYSPGEVTDNSPIAPHQTIYTAKTRVDGDTMQKLFELKSKAKARRDQDKGGLYVYGWVTYRDIFERTPTRLTEYCYELTGLLPASEGHPYGQDQWSYCGEHNCTDEECKDYKEKTLPN